MAIYTAFSFVFIIAIILASIIFIKNNYYKAKPNLVQMTNEQ